MRQISLFVVSGLWDVWGSVCVEEDRSHCKYAHILLFFFNFSLALSRFSAWIKHHIREGNDLKPDLRTVSLVWSALEARGFIVFLNEFSVGGFRSRFSINKLSAVDCQTIVEVIINIPVCVCVCVCHCSVNSNTALVPLLKTSDETRADKQSLCFLSFFHL